MKVNVCINNQRGNLNVGTRTVEASTVCEGLRQVLAELDPKTFKKAVYITARAWGASDTVSIIPSSGEVAV